MSEQVNPVFAAAIEAAANSMLRIKRALANLGKGIEMEPETREAYREFAYQRKIERERRQGLNFVRRLGAEARASHFAACSDCPVCAAERKALMEEDE